MKISFSKMQGLGNDFVVINNLELQYQFSSLEIRQLADRKFGVGCDQVLIVDRPTSDDSDFFYRIYNSDGSEAGQCGNGARCFIKFLHDHCLISKPEVTLQTLSRKVEGRLYFDGTIEVNMGSPDFCAKNIPLMLENANEYEFVNSKGAFRFMALSMGNPHAVVVVDGEDKLSDEGFLSTIGVELQQSNIFPKSVNVNFMYIRNQKEIVLRTYERGSGLTLACGSGACAAAVIAIRDGLVANRVRVKMLGGELEVEWLLNTGVLMRGEAVHVFDGVINLCV